MTCPNEQRAKKFLLYHNYYKIINGYDDIFVRNPNPDKSYKQGVTFEQILALSLFDHELRTLSFNYIMMVENKLKALISHEFSAHNDPYGYLDPNHYDINDANASGTIFVNLKKQQKVRYLISHLYKMQIKWHDRPHVMKFNENGVLAPIWSFIITFSLGELINFYDNLQEKTQIKIADHFNLFASDLVPILRQINAFRNQCAHNDRIYCFQSPKAKLPQTNPYIDMLNYPIIRNHYFSFMICLKHILGKSRFQRYFEQLDSLLIGLNTTLTKKQVEHVRLKMGFPANWKNLRDL